MYYTSWNFKYELGIESIDSDHQNLVRIIDDLIGALAEGKGNAITEPLLKKLSDYTISHFRREEFLMKSANYDDLESHMSQHQLFIEKIKEFQQKHKSGFEGVAIEMMKFLKEWLVNHILVIDKKYQGVIKTKMGLK
jgi:hemerythrin-like metal-binding domain